MSLFKRLLLSLFPEKFGESFGPASMFLGLINAKHFFTVITKRMVENPKLNLFDVGMDPVEVKIGFGNEAQIKPKDLELYFSYCVCANLNGYKFYNPTNIAALVSIALSQFFIQDFSKDKKGTDQCMVFLICINIVAYVFAGRVKVFPPDLNKKDSFNRFVTVFFNYYKFLLMMYQVKISKKAWIDLQATLVARSDIFFGLYYLYKNINTYLDDEPVTQDYIEWLFAEELRKGKTKGDFAKFQAQVGEYVYSSDLSPMEDKLLDALMPAEILMKLLFNREDVFWMSEYVIPHIYDNQIMETFMHSFLTSDEKLEERIEYIMDHRLWKLNFFSSLKKMLIHKFHKNDPGTESVEDLLSSISDGMEIPDIPENLKKEGMLMDRVLNFYVGLMGSMRIGRGDTMFLRIFRGNLMIDIRNGLANIQGTASINYYTDILFQYSKNVFFYKTIFDGVRSGKASFMLPYVADIKEVQNNATVLRELDQNAIAILLQDMLSKDIKLSIRQESIVSQFQSLHGARISEWIKYNQNTFLELVFGGFDRILTRPVFVPSLIANIETKDIKNIKENLYTLEFWIFADLLEVIGDLDLQSRYADGVILNILATLKDTLVGILFLLHTCLNKQLDKKIDLKIHSLLNSYGGDVVRLLPELCDGLSVLIHTLYIKYKNIIDLWVKIDDNQYFLEVGADCWRIFINKELDAGYQISIEDGLWFRGYLKHITYYNKRFVAPKL